MLVDSLEGRRGAYLDGLHFDLFGVVWLVWFGR
jgi:hypothetical protein